MGNIISGATGAVLALAIAILSGLGVGSGGLLVILLTLLGNVAPEDARGLNLLFFVFSSSAALLVHTIKRRIRPKLVFLLAGFSCVGTFIGTFLGMRIDPYLLKKIFGAVLVTSGGYNLFIKLFKKNNHNQRHSEIKYK